MQFVFVLFMVSNPFFMKADLPIANPQIVNQANYNILIRTSVSQLPCCSFVDSGCTVNPNLDFLEASNYTNGTFYSTVLNFYGCSPYDCAPSTTILEFF